ncbi:MAG TPA: pyruvate kinase [Patescibacteria group bacterium]
MKTKIIATIGPATLDFKIFQKLVDSGIDFIRINTSYGDFDQYDLMLRNLKEVKKKNIEVIFDIKNLEVLDYFKKNNLKYVAVSFTQSITQLKKVKETVPQAFIISKIESVEGVKNFEAILEASDGVMVARGDLAEAENLEKVPCLQKSFTKKTLKAGKYLIAATEMMLSMTQNPTPTRAEVSDVANAVFDGASAVMLSEETAIGKYPVETVEFMRKIIKEAEDCNEN